MKSEVSIQTTLYIYATPINESHRGALGELCRLSREVRTYGIVYFSSGKEKGFIAARANIGPHDAGGGIRDEIEGHPAETAHVLTQLLLMICLLVKY